MKNKFKNIPCPQLFKEALDSYNNFAFGNPKLVDLKKI